MQSIIRRRKRLRQTRKSIRKSNKDATRTQGRIADGERERWKVATVQEARRILELRSGWGNVARAQHTLPLNVYARIEGNVTIMGPSEPEAEIQGFLRAKVATLAGIWLLPLLKILAWPLPLPLPLLRLRLRLRVHLGYKWFSYACSLGDLFVLFPAKRHSNERGVKSGSVLVSGSLTSVWTQGVMELCTNFCSFFVISQSWEFVAELCVFLRVHSVILYTR